MKLNTAKFKMDMNVLNVMIFIHQVLSKFIIFNYKLGHGKCHENIEKCLSQHGDTCLRCEPGYTASNFKHKYKGIKHAC